jgi:hypothetical protein
MTKPVTVATVSNPKTKRTPEEQEAMNAIRASRGASSLPSKANGCSESTQNGTQNDAEKLQCQYCNYYDHLQWDFSKCCASGAPMVDTQGQPYQKNSVCCQHPNGPRPVSPVSFKLECDLDNT